MHHSCGKIIMMTMMTGIVYNGSSRFHLLRMACTLERCISACSGASGEYTSQVAIDDRWQRESTIVCHCSWSSLPRISMGCLTPTFIYFQPWHVWQMIGDFFMSTGHSWMHTHTRTAVHTCFRGTCECTVMYSQWQVCCASKFWNYTIEYQTELHNQQYT